MTFPNFKNKHEEEAMVTPKQYLKYYLKSEGLQNFIVPEGMIICYQGSLLKYILKHHKVTKMEAFGDTYYLRETKNKIAITGNFGIGGPAVVTKLEEFIALGTKQFISIGTAGTLSKSLKVGDLVVCDKAIRDEGTSHHYLKPSKYSYASKALTKKIQEVLTGNRLKFVTGTSWTIDAPYRETIAEARQYQKEGVLTVEMEAAALFAAAQLRNVELGSIITISDSLAELSWSPKMNTKKVSLNLEKIYKVALTCLSKQ